MDCVTCFIYVLPCECTEIPQKDLFMLYLLFLADYAYWGNQVLPQQVKILQLLIPYNV